MSKRNRACKKSRLSNNDSGIQAYELSDVSDSSGSSWKSEDLNSSERSSNSRASSYLYCETCDISFGLNKDRNCFNSFHKK